ncbi:MAG TPA: gluconate 2-dehydrogenase subunit 3 family protein [Rhodopila sp.]|nr:gluconate 2-dehydrogenase subunit 3 family protein [Rhodopila sp.]
MPDRFPGYNVLSKRQTPSWNEQTRRVIDQRLAVPREPRFFTEHEFNTVAVLANHIVPQPKHRPPIPVAPLVDAKLFADKQDGYRQEGMPREREAWQRGIRALDAEAESAHGSTFRALRPDQQVELMKRMEKGDMHNPAWGGMPPKTFWKARLLRDIIFAYWSHPIAWNEIGWGGPASPRGYVRLGFDQRDPWEAAEVQNGDVESAERKNYRVG